MIVFDRKAATVPGKRITDLQVNKYKALRGEHSQEASAVKTGISDGRMTEISGDGVQEGMAVITDQRAAGAAP